MQTEEHVICYCSLSDCSITVWCCAFSSIADFLDSRCSLSCVSFDSDDLRLKLSFLLRYFDVCLLLVTSCSCLLSLCNWQQCVVSFCSLSFSHMLLLLLLLLLLSTVLVVHAIFIFHLLWVGEWGSRSCGWERWDAGVDMQIELCVMSSRLSPVSTCDKCC